MQARRPSPVFNQGCYDSPLGARVGFRVICRKTLELWQRFSVESRLYGHDEKSVYLVHRAVVRGEIYAEMLVRARFLRRGGGVVPLEELFDALGRPDDLPPLQPWVIDWAAASALPSTREQAPSSWP